MAPVGTEAPVIHGLTPDTLLHRVEGGWEMQTDGEAVHRATDADVRITVSWKGEVYADEADRQRALDHSDDIDLDHVVTTLLADMRSRGVDVDAPVTPTTTRPGSPPSAAPTAARPRSPPDPHPRTGRGRCTSGYTNPYQFAVCSNW